MSERATRKKMKEMLRKVTSVILLMIIGLCPAKVTGKFINIAILADRFFPISKQFCMMIFRYFNVLSRSAGPIWAKLRQNILKGPIQITKPIEILKINMQICLLIGRSISGVNRIRYVNSSVYRV